MAYFALVQAANEFDGRGDFEGFAKDRVRWRIIDYLRAEGHLRRAGAKSVRAALSLNGRTGAPIRDQYRDEAEIGDSIADPSGEAVLDMVELDDLLESYLRHADPKMRTIIQMRVNGFTPREIADTVGLTEGGMFYKLKMYRRKHGGDTTFQDGV